MILILMGYDIKEQYLNNKKKSEILIKKEKKQQNNGHNNLDFLDNKPKYTRYDHKDNSKIRLFRMILWSFIGG